MYSEDHTGLHLLIYIYIPIILVSLSVYTYICGLVLQNKCISHTSYSSDSAVTQSKILFCNRIAASFI